MKKERLLELAGIDEAQKAYAVIVKHKGQPAVAITPTHGVTKDRAMEVKKVLMDMKKEGMRSGKPSDYAEVTVKPVGTIKENVNLNEEMTPEQEQKIAENTFKVLDKIMDDLEQIHNRIEHKSLLISMHKLGLVHEREALAESVGTALKEFEDFMPGLEMQKNGET